MTLLQKIYGATIENTSIGQEQAATASFTSVTANLQLNQNYAPPKPDQTDKAMCVAYDCALDVDYDIVTRKLKLNKTPPLSHAR
jgi:hypothetical protein